MSKDMMLLLKMIITQHLIFVACHFAFRYGKLVASNPFWAISACFVITGLCAIGLVSSICLDADESKYTLSRELIYTSMTFFKRLSKVFS